MRETVHQAENEGEVILIDKPAGWTSFDVVKRIRWTFGVKKAGHAGTLDPRATGLLIVCTGKKTKDIHQFVGLDKEYTGSFELGIRTASFDSETEVLERREHSTITLERLREAVKAFIGASLQVPPMYSAVKYRGKPLYKYARRGKSVERAPKEIVVSEFEITAFQAPLAEFRVVCSKGTYVRSLVNDLGESLGCGATLRSLRRTRIGEYLIRDAMTIEQLENMHSKRVVKHTRAAHESSLQA